MTSGGSAKGIPLEASTPLASRGEPVSIPTFNTTREVMVLAETTWRIAGIKHVDARRNESFIASLLPRVSMTGKESILRGKEVVMDNPREGGENKGRLMILTWSTP
jgi:hypothetical protein